ncbi:hypothetical protein OSTOST_07960 [Ostertagia ostertagi]
MSSITVLTFSFIASAVGTTFEPDPNGYVVFCPCMGRFGNQVDQLLGVMQFTRYLDRTLVLPYFIEYPFPNTVMVPFESVFQVAEAKKYVRAITMGVFQREVMPVLWPKENRTAVCWSPRKSIYDESAPVGCQAKEGNPFGPYWDKVGVSFAHDAYYGDLPGAYDLTARGSKAAWLERFPPSEFPVLAFPSPPAAFPSRPGVWELQRYLKWSSRIMSKATKFINEKLSRPFVGIHLRNDKDWVIDWVGKIGARSVFVASDKDHMIETLNEALNAYEVKAYRLNPDDALVSLAILGQSDHFIGNCVSTFSHIVRRERNVSKPPKPTSYFGIKGQERRIEL